MCFGCESSNILICLLLQKEVGMLELGRKGIHYVSLDHVVLVGEAGIFWKNDMQFTYQ